MQDKVKVPVGVTSATGYGVTLTAVVAAVVAYANGDHSVDNATVIGLGVIAGVTYVITAIGRHAQAVKATPKVIRHEHTSDLANPVVLEEAIKDSPHFQFVEGYDQADFAEPEPEQDHYDPGAGYDPRLAVAGTWDEDQAKIAASKHAMTWQEQAHDLVDEPPDTGSDRVPEHELRDLHDGGRC